MATIKIGINGFGRIGRYVILNIIVLWNGPSMSVSERIGDRAER